MMEDAFMKLFEIAAQRGCKLRDGKGWLLKYIPVNDQFTCFHLKRLCQTFYQ